MRIFKYECISDDPHPFGQFHDKIHLMANIISNQLYGRVSRINGTVNIIAIVNNLVTSCYTNQLKEQIDTVFYYSIRKRQSVSECMYVCRVEFCLMLPLFWQCVDRIVSVFSIDYFLCPNIFH